MSRPLTRSPTALAETRPSSLSDASRRLDEILRDQRFEQLCELLLPKESSVDVYVVPAKLPLKNGAQAWVKPTDQQGIDRRRAVATHLLAGERGESMPLVGCRGLVNAVGFGYSPEALISYLSIDLDGAVGYPPLDIINKLIDRFGAGRFVVHSGSGREGRYRCAARILEAPVWKARDDMAEILEGLGFPLQSGGVEIFPATSNGRLPFGWGGRQVFQHPGLGSDGLAYDWHWLVKWLLESKPLNLARPVVSPRAKTKEAPTRPAPSRLPPPSSACSNPWSKVQRWWSEGVERGERDEALFMLLRDCRRRGLSQEKAVQELRRWIADDKLAKSSIGNNRGALRYTADHEVPRIARNVYKFLPPKLRATPLTAREITMVVSIAEARCPQQDDEAGRRKQVAEAIGLLLASLPWFKTAARLEFDGVSLHRDRWTALLGRQEGYAHTRELLGLFVSDGRHYFPGERSITWHLRAPSMFPFDQEAPRSAVVATRGKTLGQIVARARKVAARYSKRQPK